MAPRRSDLTQPFDLSCHVCGTGPVRAQRPVYIDFLPPCNHACPAGENFQAWLAHTLQHLEPGR